MRTLILSLLAFAAIVIMGSCAKYDTTLLNDARYKQVYMPRAENGPVEQAITQKDSSLHFLYSAYLGGAAPASKSISVDFGVQQEMVDQYNQENGTDYKLLPNANYSLQNSATITAGSRSTDSLDLEIKTNADLNLFETYLLPLSVTKISGDGSINHKLQTTYFIFSVGYAQGEVPRTKVLSLGDQWGGIFCGGPKHTILSNNKNNFDIYLYLPDDQGDFTGPPLDIAYNYNASESFYFVNDSSMLIRNFPSYAGLFNFNMNYWNIRQDNPDPASNIIYGAANFWLGDHWDAYQIAPYNNYLMTLDNNGNLYRQPIYSFIEVDKTQVGSGFTDTKQLIEYPEAHANSLLALDQSGNLWYIPMNPDGEPGAKKQVGSGWDMYQRIMVSGSDILGIDNKNDVYRYPFNPKGFYPL